MEFIINWMNWKSLTRALWFFDKIQWEKKKIYKICCNNWIEIKCGTTVELWIWHFERFIFTLQS